MIKLLKHRQKRTVAQNIGVSIAVVVFLLYAAFILFFFLFAFLIAIKEDHMAFIDDQINVRLFRFPEHPTLKHFFNVFTVWLQ